MPSPHCETNANVYLYVLCETSEIKNSKLGTLTRVGKHNWNSVKMMTRRCISSRERNKEVQRKGSKHYLESREKYSCVLIYALHLKMENMSQKVTYIRCNSLVGISLWADTIDAIVAHMCYRSENNSLVQRWFEGIYHVLRWFYRRIRVRVNGKWLRGQNEVLPIQKCMRTTGNAPENFRLVATRCMQMRRRQSRCSRFQAQIDHVKSVTVSLFIVFPIWYYRLSPAAVSKNEIYRVVQLRRWLLPIYDGIFREKLNSLLLVLVELCAHRSVFRTLARRKHMLLTEHSPWFGH